MGTRVKQLIVVCVLTTVTQTQAQELREGGVDNIVGSVDNDIVIVPDQLVVPTPTAKEKKRINFIWVIDHTNNKNLLTKGREPYNLQGINSSVDCARPTVIDSYRRDWIYRENQNGIKRSMGDVVATEEGALDSTGKKLRPLRSEEIEPHSPAAIAVEYACAVAESKAKGTRVKYIDPTKPGPNATHLLCELPKKNLNGLQEIPVSFVENPQKIFIGRSLVSGEITDTAITVFMRRYYGDTEVESLKISRVTGRATLAVPSLRYSLPEGSCRPSRKQF